MPRPKFSLKTLLWLMALVAAFVGGIRVGRDRQRREDMLSEQIARANQLAAEAEEKARAEKWLLEMEEASKEGVRQRNIYTDKRWKIPGAIRRSDGTFYREVRNPDGSVHEEPISRID